MTIPTNNQHFKSIQEWVNTMRPHWIRCEGNVFNDKEFWHECIHGPKEIVWINWCEVYNQLRESAIGRYHLTKHTYLYEDTCELVNRLSQNKRITIPYNKTGYNKPIFRMAMAIKDVIADLTEQPFQTKPVAKRKPTKDEVMAKIDEMQAMVNELFE